jgi:hypothetical protein
MNPKTMNRYCTRCNRTTSFHIEGSTFTCSVCRVRVEPAARSTESRTLIGDPFRNFRVGFG